MVTVIATDPKGDTNRRWQLPLTPTSLAGVYATPSMVTINVTPVDEPPIFTVTSAAVGDDVITDAGEFVAVSFEEVTGIDATDNSEAEGGEIGIALFTYDGGPTRRTGDLDATDGYPWDQGRRQ